MEVALVFSGAKDAISLTITKLNIDMHHVKTVFFFFRHLGSRIMAVAMAPNPDKLQENVVLKFRNLDVKARSKLVCGNRSFRCKVVSIH